MRAAPCDWMGRLTGGPGRASRVAVPERVSHTGGKSAFRHGLCDDGKSGDGNRDRGESVEVKPSQPAQDEDHREKFHPMYVQTGFHGTQAWHTAPAEFGEHTLRILGHPVMEDWELPYMRKLAEIASGNGGRVLEIGFGMGISAGFIGENPRVTEHVVIEANHDVAERARKYAGTYPEGRVRVVEGFSYDVLDQFELGSFDGILHDAYPLEESEVQYQARFAPTAYRLLRPGGVFTYFSDEPRAYRPEHLKILTDAGFAEENISFEIVAVRPPADCKYWESDTILAPILVK